MKKKLFRDFCFYSWVGFISGAIILTTGVAFIALDFFAMTGRQDLSTPGLLLLALGSVCLMISFLCRRWRLR